MTTPIKTQCPHCHAIFNIKKTQLNQKTANVCCEHCQHSFLVNNNLIVTADTESTTDDDIVNEHKSNEHKSVAASTSKVSISKQISNSKQISKILSESKITTKPTIISEADILIHDNMPDETLIHDELIHDDMDVEAVEEEDLEYGSLDSMDAWLTQAADSTPASTINRNTHSAVNSVENPSLANTFLNESPSAAQVALSSAAANNIHASIDDKSDESWLEKLLKEQNQNEAEHSPKSETDLSELLASMGVSTKDDDNNHAARTKSQQAQAKFSSTPTKRSIASLLWTLGCLVLALLLFAQYVIFNLDNLVKNPAHAARLQTLCSIAACSLPSANLAALNTSDVGHRPSRIKAADTFSDINVTLNNKSSQAQLLPHVKISIYSDNALIGEFIAAPQDYLLSTQNQLGALNRKQLLFTVPVANAQINRVSAEPIY